MSSNHYQGLDDLLRTLSSYASATPQTQTSTPQQAHYPQLQPSTQYGLPQHQSAAANGDLQAQRLYYDGGQNHTLAGVADYGYLNLSHYLQQPPPEAIPTHPQIPQSGPQIPSRTSTPTQAPPRPQSKVQAPQVPQTSLPDARTIVEWPTALRHVTKLAARNEKLGDSIKKLIDNQHDNERQWFAGRQALIEKQQARVAGKQELDDVLRSVGALTSSASTADDDVAEIATYDIKVHRAAQAMAKAMSADLEALHIPFFGTDPGLLMDDPGGKVVVYKDDKRPDMKGKITRMELRTLQGRIVQHLEDMYVD